VGLKAFSPRSVCEDLDLSDGVCQPTILMWSESRCRQSCENSLMQHGEGICLGISPLRARDFWSVGQLRGAPVEMTGVEGNLKKMAR